MSDYKFGVGEYPTRGGEKAVVQVDDLAGDYPLAGYVVGPDGQKFWEMWFLDGRALLHKKDGRDLMPPAPAKPEPVVLWVNMLSHPERGVYGTGYRSEALAEQDVPPWEMSGWTLLRTIRVSSEPEPDRYAEGWDAAIEAAGSHLEVRGFIGSLTVVRALKGKANG